MAKQVSVVAPNCPAVSEMNFGIPIAGVVLNIMNVRLDTKTLCVLFRHCETKLLLVDY